MIEVALFISIFYEVSGTFEEKGKEKAPKAGGLPESSMSGHMVKSHVTVIKGWRAIILLCIFAALMPGSGWVQRVTEMWATVY